MDKMIMTEEMLTATRYQSHLPALLACHAASTGATLEIGVSHFSTPQLHALATVFRRVISIESSTEWLTYFKDRYQDSERHRFHLVEYKTVLPLFAKEYWGVVLIDHSPGGENRADAFRAMIGSCDFIVVHDYELDNKEAIAPLLVGLNFHVCHSYQPPTLVASKTQKLPESVLEL